MQCRYIMIAPVPFWLLTLVLATAAAAADGVAIPGADRQRELIHLLRQDCGACHGLLLTGGLGPGLRPQDLRGKSVESLGTVILKGRPGTPMPEWQAFITESEAAWLAETLLKGLPDDH
jgi:cytochrome c55X